MRLQAHVLLITALSDVALKTKEEPESYHIQQAKMLVSWEEVQKAIQAGNKHDAAAVLIEAAAHLCHAVDKILDHKARRD